MVVFVCLHRVRTLLQKPGKFYPIELDYGSETKEVKLIDVSKSTGKRSVSSCWSPKLMHYVLGSTLDPRLQQLVSLMFDIEMMKHTLIELEIDVKKMPLGMYHHDLAAEFMLMSLFRSTGKLTKRNIQNGYEVLNEIQAVLDGNDTNKEAKLLDLTNKFFTIIPQDFGEERPQPIGTRGC